MDAKTDLNIAAATWNQSYENLDQANVAISDGVPLDQLIARADDYASQIFGRFPYANPEAGASVMEIGSGTGYIMEAVHRYLLGHQRTPASMTGLDIAPNMIERASARIAGKGPFSFLRYDGIHIPVPDASVDFIYSVAAIQHIPKPFAYNLFFEMKRILKPHGYAVVHLLNFKELRSQEERVVTWREEINRQISRAEGHWHHFYSKDELDNVLAVGTRFRHVDVRDDGSMWACVGDTAPLSSRLGAGRYLGLLRRAARKLRG